MIIRKKSLIDIPKEEAHGGEGGRRLYLDVNELTNKDFQAMTYGFLSAGNKFSWHKHENIEEVMLVLKGNGFVRDKEGEYLYTDGDLFIFPADTEHEIDNTSNYENEFIFIRIRNS